MSIIAFQILILVGMFGKAFYPLWIGEELMFKVLPRDPRDIFRGNYVELRYSFNNINLNELTNDLDRLGKYRFGDKLYVELALKNGFYEPIGIWQNPPENKKFLQVITEDTYGYDTLQSISVSAGIESYFTSAENALKIERLTVSDSMEVSVDIMVAPDGKARIKKINTKPIKRQEVTQGDNSVQ
ncbi:MAG: GDYXXLXY domain-containing protein [Thermoflexibacter sp.]